MMKKSGLFKSWIKKSSYEEIEINTAQIKKNSALLSKKIDRIIKIPNAMPAINLLKSNFNFPKSSNPFFVIFKSGY